MTVGESSTVQLDTGISVPFASGGAPTGTPLVLLHGWGEARGIFDRLVPELPHSIRTLTFDQRGHGGASKPHSGYSLEDAADDVRAFLDVMGIGAAALLGSSSGGYLAQQVAIMWPTRVRALVLVGAPRSLEGRAPFADDVEKLADPVDPGWVRASLEWFPIVEPVPRWYLDDRVRDGVRIPAHVWRMSLAGLGAAPPPTDVGTIACPTLILRGAEDELLAAVEHDALAAAIPGSRLIVYEATGHLVLWERPERVAADVTGFLSGVGASS